MLFVIFLMAPPRTMKSQMRKLCRTEESFMWYIFRKARDFRAGPGFPNRNVLDTIRAPNLTRLVQIIRHLLGHT